MGLPRRIKLFLPVPILSGFPAALTISALTQMRTEFFGEYTGCANRDVACATAAASLYSGLINSLSALFACVLLPVYGILSDKYGRKPFLLLAAFACCLPRVALTIPDNLWIYYASAVLSSALGADGGPVWSAYISDTSEHEDRVNAYAAFAAVVMVGIALMPSFGTWLELRYGWDVVVYLSVVLTAMAVIYVAICVPETLSRRAERLCTAKPVSWGFLASSAKSPMVSYCLWTVLYTTLPMTAMAEINLLYLTSTLGFGVEQTSYFLLALGLTGFLANMMILPLLVNQRWSEFSLVIMGLVSCCAYYVALAFATSSAQVFFSLLLTIPSYFLQPVISTLISEHASPAHQGQAQGLKAAVDGACSSVAPAVTGVLFAHLSRTGSSRIICLLNAGLVLVGIVVSLFHFPAALKRQKLISQYDIKLSLSPSMNSDMASPLFED